MQSCIDRFFHITERGSTVRRELVAGLTNFMAMCYIIFAVPGLLAEAGLPKDAAVAETICVTLFATVKQNRSK